MSTTNDVTAATLQQWIGRTETRQDTIELRSVHFMQATFDQAPSLQCHDPLPLLWHWMYFNHASPMGELGRDGHPRLGGFLPPVGLPRRMWAGGRFRFERPLPIGCSATRVSKIKSVTPKDGRSGKLCFVTVEHTIFHDDLLCISEQHDIVYREDPIPGTTPPEPPSAPAESHWRRTILPTPVLLFRYSALTFNGHRIHYDRSYCIDVEGYPGLVVHGPLTATLLVTLAQENNPARSVRSYNFTAVSPLFDTHPFEVIGIDCGDGAKLWAVNPGGEISMRAEAGFAAI